MTLPFIIFLILVEAIGSLIFGLSNVQQYPILSQGFGVLPTILGVAGIYFLGGITIVDQWTRVPVFRFGKYVRTVGAGFNWIEPIFNTFWEPEDINDVVLSLSVNGVQSRDNVPLSLVFTITKRLPEDKVKDFCVNVMDGAEALEARALVTVTELAATKTLDHLLHQRKEFCDEAIKALQAKIQNWGVEILALEIQTMKIEHDAIVEAMTMQARAQREGEAEVIRAQKQVEVARHLQEAAAIYRDPTAMELRRLDTLAELGRGENNTILFPTSALDAVQRITGSKNEPASTSPAA